MPYKDPAEQKARNRRYYQENKEQLKSAVRAYADANKAKVSERRKDYYWKNADAIKQKTNTYYHANRERCGERHKRWAAEHRDQIKASNREYHIANRDRLREGAKARYRKDVTAYVRRAREWAEANPEKVREIRRRHQSSPSYKAKAAHWKEMYPEKMRTYQKTWRERNRSWCLAAYNEYRARQIGASVGTDRKAYKAFVLMARSAKSIPCYWCGKPIPKNTQQKKERHIDHIIPLIDGGADDVFNLCVSCRECNSSKGKKRPEHFTGQFEIVFPIAVA
jgi:hypothetical protein